MPIQQPFGLSASFFIDVDWQACTAAAWSAPECSEARPA